MAAIMTPMTLVISLVLIAGVVAWFRHRFWGLRIRRARRIATLKRLNLVIFAKWHGRASEWALDWEFSRFLQEVSKARRIGVSYEDINGVLDELARKWMIFPELKVIQNQDPEALVEYVQYLKIPWEGGAQT